MKRNYFKRLGIVNNTGVDVSDSTIINKTESEISIAKREFCKNNPNDPSCKSVNGNVMVITPVTAYAENRNNVGIKFNSGGIV